jgi:hypothetical protein
MYNTNITVGLEYDELRAVIKSLSIGCDQLSKKLDRLSSTRYSQETQEELLLLMRATSKFNDALSETISEAM